MWKCWQIQIKWHCWYIRWETWSMNYYWLGVKVWIHSFCLKGSSSARGCCLAYIFLFTILFKVISYLKWASNQLLVKSMLQWITRTRFAWQLSLLNALKEGLTDVFSQALCVSLLPSPSLLSQDLQHCGPCQAAIHPVPRTLCYGNQLSNSKEPSGKGHSS